jgi:hypothetical protein
MGDGEIEGEELPTGDDHRCALAGAAEQRRRTPGALLFEPCEHPCTGLAPGRTKAAARLHLQVRLEPILSLLWNSLNLLN